jgi:hypothetical protein
MADTVQPVKVPIPRQEEASVITLEVGGHQSVDADAAGIHQTRAVSPASFTPRQALWRIFCFLGIMAICVIAMNAAITFGLRQVKTSSYGAWNQLMQGRINADIIISGSSRATYHYDPRKIEQSTGLSAFNIGRVGTQTDVQLAVLKAYLEHNRKPKLVVHNLDAFSFVMSREIYDPTLYVPYLGDSEIYDALLKIDPNIKKSRYLPLYGYVVEDMNFTWVQGLKALVGISPKQNYFLGFCPRDKVWSDDFHHFKTANPSGVKFTIEPAGVEALRQLIELCQKNGIQLVLVYSPEYRGMQEMTNNRQDIFAEFHNLANQYHVQLWDYSGWKNDGDEDLFYNSQHLNAKGAALFSDDVAARLKSYMATQSQSASVVQMSGTTTFRGAARD